MKLQGSSKQPHNIKNGVHGGVDIQKMHAQQMKRECRYGMPKGHVDATIDYISNTYHITRMQLFLLAGVAVVTFATGGIDGEFLLETDNRATPHVSNDRIDRDCNAGLPIVVFTPSDDRADASANSVLAAMADSIFQRTEQWIGNGAKNVVY